MNNVNLNLVLLSYALFKILQTNIKSKSIDLRCASTDQAIVSATCPKAFLNPLKLGLMVTLDHKYDHRDPIDLLFNIGFRSSYLASSLFKKTAAATQGVGVGELPSDKVK